MKKAVEKVFFIEEKIKQTIYESKENYEKKRINQPQEEGKIKGKFAFITGILSIIFSIVAMVAYFFGFLIATGFLQVGVKFHKVVYDNLC